MVTCHSTEIVAHKDATVFSLLYVSLSLSQDSVEQDSDTDSELEEISLEEPTAQAQRWAKQTRSLL